MFFDFTKLNIIKKINYEAANWNAFNNVATKTFQINDILLNLNEQNIYFNRNWADCMGLL